MFFVKVVVIGAPGCGRTSLIKQFVEADCNIEEDDRCGNSISKRIYYPTIVMDDRLYEVQLVDLPLIQNFPQDSLEEWNTCKGFGVRRASAYLLVFDVTLPETFVFIHHLRDQIMRSKPDEEPTIVVAANKQDLLASCLSRQLVNQTDQTIRYNNSFAVTPSISRPGGHKGSDSSQRQQNFLFKGNRACNNGGASFLRLVLENRRIKLRKEPCTSTSSSQNFSLLPSLLSQNGRSSVSKISGSATAVVPQNSITNAYPSASCFNFDMNPMQLAADTNKEFAAIVRKQWKCAYVECSAKYNWRVTAIFMEVMKLIEKRADGELFRSTEYGERRRRKCIIQ